MIAFAERTCGNFLYFVRDVHVIESRLAKLEEVFRRGMAENTGGDMRLDLELDWGGREGPKISGSVGIQIHDDKGNQVEGKIQQDSDGTGSAKISVSHEKN